MQHLTYLVLLTLISIAVSVMGFGIQRTSQNASIASLQYERVNKKVVTAIEMIEQDFRNLGSGVSSAAEAFPGAQVDTTSCRQSVGSMCYIVFQARIDQDVPTPRVIRYGWTKTDSISVKTGLEVERVPTYTLVRKVDGLYSSTLLERMTEFDVRLMNAAGKQLTGPPQETERIEIALAVATRVDDSETYDYQRRWQNTFRPVSLIIM